jgi:hypothetical protein
MTGGTADNGDFAFSVKLVINDVKSLITRNTCKLLLTKNYSILIIKKTTLINGAKTMLKHSGNMYNI